MSATTCKSQVAALIAMAQKASDERILELVEKAVPVLDELWWKGYMQGKQSILDNLHTCRNCKHASSEGRGDWSCNLENGKFTGDYDTCERWQEL